MKSLRSLSVLVFILILVSAACSSSSGDRVLGANRGQVQVMLSAGSSSSSATAAGRSATALGGAASGALSPADDDGEHEGEGEAVRRLQSAEVTFSSLLARNLAGELIPLQTPLPAVVDVLGIADGQSVSLPMGTLPAGTYDQMVVVMTRVDLLTIADVAVSITPPGGGWTAIVPVCPFEVIEGEMTTIGLRMFRGLSFELNGPDNFGFVPHFECEPM